MFLDAGFSLDVQGSGYGTLGLSLQLHENRGGTLLALAAQVKDRNTAEGAVDLLLEHGAQLNQPTSSCNHTPLLCTVLKVARSNVQTTESFAKKIINNNALGDMYMYEPLVRDLSDCELLATKLLSEKGADPLFWHGSGKSALTVAAAVWRNDIRGQDAAGIC